MRLLFTIVLLVFLAGPSQGQEIGSLRLSAPDGNEKTFQGLASRSVSVVLFVSIDCPYSQYYEERIADLINRYNSSVSFLLVNPNPGELSKSYQPEPAHNAPYLLDRGQEVAKALEVRKCPQAVVLKKTGNAYEIQYNGAIDDSPQLASDVQHPYLQDAIESVLKGQTPSSSSTRPTGCMIRMN